VYDPDDRADIFEVVNKLRDGLQQALQEENGINGGQGSRNLRENDRVGILDGVGKALRSASLTTNDKLP
jgi:hypothetical protein